MKVLRRLALILASLVVLLFGAAFLVNRPGDAALFPAPNGTLVHTVYLVSHGMHAGLAIPADELAERARRNGWASLAEVAERFGFQAYLEIGWGDEGFYRGVPTYADITLVESLRALFRPGNPSVLHVVGFRWGSPRATYPMLEQRAVPLTEAGFERLLAHVEASFARDGGNLRELGPGHYGPSLFYAARGTFSILNLCNHWAADALDAAGVPTNRLLATWPGLMFWDLERRAGIGRDGA